MTGLIKCDWCGRIVEMGNSGYGHLELSDTNFQIIVKGDVCPTCTKELVDRFPKKESPKQTHGAEFYSKIGDKGKLEHKN